MARATSTLQQQSGLRPPSKYRTFRQHTEVVQQKNEADRQDNEPADQSSAPTRYSHK
jgi:hypothetical protein